MNIAQETNSTEGVLSIADRLAELRLKLDGIKNVPAVGSSVMKGDAAHGSWPKVFSSRFPQFEATQSLKQRVTKMAFSKHELASSDRAHGGALSGSRGSSGDKPEKTFMKHTLLTIPVEILEKIAHSAEKKVLLILGLTSTEVEKRTFNVFEARFLTNMVWDNYNTEAVGRVIAGLKAMPILAQRVKHLDFIFRDGRGNFINDSLDSFEADVRVLQNLSSLYFHGVHDQDWSYWGDRTLIYVPRLSQLTISACSNCYSFDWIGQFLEIHKATLTSVRCFDIAVEGPYQNHQPGWSRLLQAAKVLREAATVEISRPRVHVVSEKRRSKLFFVSLALFQKDTDAATDMAATPVSVLVGAKNGFNGIHYLTRAGELQIGLEHMMQNYAELHSAGDLAASGAVGYIVGLEGMDDREWREEAGLGDLDEYEDEDGDGEENGYDDYDDGWEHYARDFFSD